MRRVLTGADAAEPGATGPGPGVRGPETVTTWLDRAAVWRGDHVAVVDDVGTWTYAELRRHALSASAWLAERGVRPGDRVLVRLGNTREFVALLFGALRLGAVFVPINPAMKDFHLRSVLADAEPAVVVDDGNLGGAWSRIAELTGAQHPPGGVARPDELALLIYTSGSTSTPKAVMSTHSAVAFAVAAIAARLGYRAGDVVLAAIPLSFDYGLYQVFLAVHAGARVVLADAAAPARLPAVLRDQGVTVLPLVPSSAALLIRLAARKPLPATVRLVTNTGAELTSAVATRLRAVLPGCRVVSMYGITECKRVTIGEPDRDLVKPGAVGTALPGTDVRVVDGAGRRCAPGEVGEIVVRGPHVMAGYWRAPELTAQRFRVDPVTGGTWLHTGDHGWVDADGELFFEGRRDDLFKRRGVRTSAREVEAAALDIPGVSAAAVLPPGAHGDLAVVAVADVSPADVLAGLRERLEDAKAPARCLLVPALPLTANGKTDKNALAELFRHDGVAEETR